MRSRARPRSPATATSCGSSPGRSCRAGSRAAASPPNAAYEIKHTLGPAEGREAPVDNDAYVNLTAKVALLEAAWAAEAVDRSADAVRWTQLAERVFVPVSKEG